MNAQAQKRLMVGNALFWGAAIATPVAVQIVLDLFDYETPGRVAMGSMFAIFLISSIANLRLGTKLKQASSPS